MILMLGDGGDDASGADDGLGPLVMLMRMVMMVMVVLQVNGDDDANCGGGDEVGVADDGDGGDGGDGGHGDGHDCDERRWW